MRMVGVDGGYNSADAGPIVCVDLLELFSELEFFINLPFIGILSIPLELGKPRV